MRCDQLQRSWKPSFLCCSECSCKIGEYAPDLISCSRVRSEHVLGCSFLCSVTRNVQSKTANESVESFNNCLNGIWRIRTIYNSAQWYLWRIRTTCWRIRTTAGELGQLGWRIRTTIKY